MLDPDEDTEIDKQAYGLYQALPLNGSDPDGPTDAEVYLQCVRREAESLPSVTISTRTVVKQHVEPSSRQEEVQLHVPSFQGDWLPHAAWCEDFLERFDHLAEELTRANEYDACAEALALEMQAVHLESAVEASAMKHSRGQPVSLHDAAQKHTHVYDQPHDEGTVEGKGGAATTQLPSTCALRKMDQVTTLQQLRVRLTKVQASNELGEPDAMWLFALLARIEGPLLTDDSALLHALFKTLVKLRARRTPPTADDVPYLSMLLVIVGGRFGQDPTLAPLYGRR